MIDTIDFARQAEHDLRGDRKLGPSSFQAWQDLDPASKAAFAPAMTFLLTNGGADATNEADRIAACRLMLLRFYLDKEEPAWSSYLLDRFLEAVMATPQGTLADLFHALYDLLANHSKLSGPLANLTKQLVIMSFTRHRKSYDGVDWAPFVRKASAGATPAQLYFLLHALPPEQVNPQLAQAMAKGLAGTPFQEEVDTALAG